MPNIKLLPLVRKEIPVEMTIGGITYEIIRFESKVSGRGFTLVPRGMLAAKEDKDHLLHYQGDIPVAFRGISFVFMPDSGEEYNPETLSIVGWSRCDSNWVGKSNCWFPGESRHNCRALRRK